MVGTECDLKTAPSVTRSLSATAVVILGLTVLYCALIYLQMQRHLWFDELLTYHIARAPSFDRLFYLVKRWDLNPPLSHLLSHASLAVSSGSRNAVRWPSVVEFYLASLLLYGYTARKLGTAFAALPVLILWYSPMLRYATEARPYALLLLFFCGLLFLWTLAVSSAQRNWIFAGVALCSVGLLCSHVLAPLSLLPFAVAEFVRFLSRRKPDYPLWAALFLPLVLVASYAPFIESYRTITYYPFAFQAGLDKLASFYWHTFGGVAWCLLLAAAAAFLVARATWNWKSLLLPLPQRALFATFLVVPLLLDLLMMHDHAPFWGRYCITTVTVLYFLCAFVIASFSGFTPRAGYLTVSLVSILLVVQQVIVPASQNILDPPPADLSALARIRPDLPFVAASGLTFVEMGEYENSALRARLFYLKDRWAAIQFANATIFEDMSDFQKEFNLPGTVEPYAQFTREHHDFLVFGTFKYPEDWLLRKLAADGAAIAPLGTWATPYKDKTLFEIHIGGRFAPEVRRPAAPAHGASNS